MFEAAVYIGKAFVEFVFVDLGGFVGVHPAGFFRFESFDLCLVLRRFVFGRVERKVFDVLGR